MSARVTRFPEKKKERAMKTEQGKVDCCLSRTMNNFMERRALRCIKRATNQKYKSRGYSFPSSFRWISLFLFFPSIFITFLRPFPPSVLNSETLYSQCCHSLGSTNTLPLSFRAVTLGNRLSRVKFSVK